MNVKTLWDAVLSDLRVNLAEGPYKMFFSDTWADNLSPDSLDVICKNSFDKSVVEKKYYSMVQETVNKIGKGEYKINFKIGAANPYKDTKKTTSDNAGPLFTIPQENESPARNIEAKKANLNPNFKFENYIMGTNNQLAFSIAQAVAESPGVVYNPFFVYSGVGLGKTHLMQAIGNKVLEKSPNKNVLYCTSETFTNDLIDALRGRKNNQTPTRFREKYRNVDVLIIDDIQFIAGKEATQEEFFHTFNALYMSQKQLVIASDRPPRDFKNIEERITSRFSSGIIADIQKPDIETRIAILRNVRDRENHTIADEVVSYIAQMVDTNIRELEGAYRLVWTFALSRGVKDIDENLVREALGQTVKATKLKPVNLNQILKAVCTYFSVTMIDVKGKRRTKDLVIPRHISMYLMYDMTQTPYMSIGEFLGGRDHTTIMHGVDKVSEELKYSTKLKQDIANIRQILDLT